MTRIMMTVQVGRRGPARAAARATARRGATAQLRAQRAAARVNHRDRDMADRDTDDSLRVRLGFRLARAPSRCHR